MKKHVDTTDTEDAGTFLEDARELLSATTNVAGEKVAAARERLTAALEKAKQGIKATDVAIHKNPYKSIAVAAGVGIIVGYFLARRGCQSKPESAVKSALKT